MEKLINVFAGLINNTKRITCKLPFFQNSLSIIHVVYWGILALLILWHVYQSLFFATTISRNIPPDEVYHLKLIEYYREIQTPFFSDQETEFQLGSVERNVYLYHYIMSKSFFLNYSELLDYLFLRRINVILSTLAVLGYVYLLHLLTKNKVVILLSTVAITNTVMFQFIGGSVSYDNLVNLLSVFFLILIVQINNNKKNSAELFFMLLIILGLGILIKTSFLPFLMLVPIVIGSLYSKKTTIKEVFNSIKKIPSILLLAFLFIVVLLVVERYGINYYKYGKLIPKCDQILTQEECSKNANFRRNASISESAGKTAYEDRINKRLSYIEYFPQWASIMNKRTHGILAHKIISKVSWYNSLYLIIVLVSIGFVIRFFRFRWNSDAMLLAFLLLYTAVVSLFINYRGYWGHGILDIAVQGRYLFPVIFIFYYFMIKYPIEYIKNTLFKTIFIGLIVIVFFSGSIFWFTNNVPKKIWYSNDLEGKLKLYDFYSTIHLKQ